MGVLPAPIEELLNTALVAELTVVDDRGRPVTHPLIPLCRLDAHRACRRSHAQPGAGRASGRGRPSGLCTIGAPAQAVPRHPRR